MGMLGEEFDLFVFHSEFRVDSLHPRTPWSKWAFNEQGSGRTFDRYAPCGQGRLKGHWYVPVWIQSDAVFDASPFRNNDDEGFDEGLYLFAHEFAHAWLAYSQYDKSGQREPLHDNDFCHCHWRWELHTPVAFPWHTEAFGPSSIMGGHFWLDHGNGRFTLHAGFAGGFSWLDLYGMGLADAEEVPDMFIVRNLQSVDDPTPSRTYTGEKETVTIDQIVAAEGPRVPGIAHSQKVFNAGFVYLLEPGQTPSGDLLGLHARYRNQVLEYWSHITGGRSQITTVVPRIANNRPPRAVGRIEAQPLVLAEGGTAEEVEVGDHFSDPDGDPLTYEVTSSDDEVAVAGMSGSIVTINPGSAGRATVTVTAKDGRGGIGYQTIAIVVDAKPDENPSDFTFVPVILSAEGRKRCLLHLGVDADQPGDGAGDPGLHLHGPCRRRERDRAGTPGAGASADRFPTWSSSSENGVWPYPIAETGSGPCGWRTPGWPHPTWGSRYGPRQQCLRAAPAWPIRGLGWRQASRMPCMCAAFARMRRTAQTWPFSTWERPRTDPSP